MKLDAAMRRQRLVQRNRAIAWALCAVFALIAVLFWTEATFGMLHVGDVGILQILSEGILALLFTIATVQTFRAGVQFNRLLSSPGLLMRDDAQDLIERPWSTVLRFTFRDD